jgi:hypothetical protein
VATQKQRRRRAKEKRHAYELVEIDEEGNETVLTASAIKAEAAPKSSPKESKSRLSGRTRGGGGRGAPQPPNWRRVLKRGALFAPIFLATVMLLGGGRLTFAGAIVQTIFLLAVFIPFSYFMDRVVYRSQQKRLAKNDGR